MKTFAVAIILIIVLAIVPAVSAKAVHKNGHKNVWLVPNIAWFNYSDCTVRWHANMTDFDFIVDLDGNHSTTTMSAFFLWDPAFGGNVADLGASYCVTYSNGIRIYTFNWAVRIGLTKISPMLPEYHIRSVGGGEYFCYTLTRPTPPTDYIAVLHASNGIDAKPVTSTFWFSMDEGVTWSSFTPRIHHHP